MDFQAAVLEFHKKHKAAISDIPTAMSLEDRMLRTRLIVEEAAEFTMAAHNNDLVEMIDAGGDLLYVVFGTFVSMGVDSRSVFAEIHRSNMTKEALEPRNQKGGKVMKRHCSCGTWEYGSKYVAGDFSNCGTNHAHSPGCPDCKGAGIIGSYEPPRIVEAVTGRLIWCRRCPIWHPLTTSCVNLDKSRTL